MILTDFSKGQLVRVINRDGDHYVGRFVSSNCRYMTVDDKRFLYKCLRSVTIERYANQR